MNFLRVKGRASGLFAALIIVMLLGVSAAWAEPVKRERAGSKGFVTISDGHFYFENGERIRFFGTNLAYGANFPDKATAARMAQDIADLGFNCVRIMSLDSGEYYSIFDHSSNSTLAYNYEMLDRFDYFVNELTKRGIYINLILHGSRMFQPEDGMAGIQTFASKFITLFDDRAIELQKQYAYDLLTHTNPYTGLRYIDDPAVAMVELTNENTIMNAWRYGYTEKLNYASMDDYYLDQLDRMWSKFLFVQYGSVSVMNNSWDTDYATFDETVRPRYSEKADYSPVHIADLMKFYYELDKAYIDTMSVYLKNEIKETAGAGLIPPISGNNLYISDVALMAQAEADFINAHVYWDHITFPREPWDRNDFEMPNRQLTATDGKKTANFSNLIGNLAISAVADMPFVVTEWNTSYPSNYRYELPPIITSYASLHDWDGLFVFAYSHDNEIGNTGVRHWFEIKNDFTARAMMPVLSKMFLNGYISPARQTVEIKYVNKTVFANGARDISEFELMLDKPVSGTVAYIHGIRKAYNQLTTTAADDIPSTADTAPYVSDTGELVWREDCFTFNTEMSQGITGTLKNKSYIRFNNLSIEKESNTIAKGPVKLVNGAVMLVSMDGKSIDSSDKMYLSAVNDSRNFGEAMNPLTGNLTNWGNYQLMRLRMTGKVTINIKSMKTFEVYALNFQGRRMGTVSANQARDGNVLSISFDLSRYNASLFEIAAINN